MAHHRSTEGLAWKRYLIRQREAKGWSQSRAFEELHALLGYGPRSRASYVALEAGRLPDPDQQAALVRFYGTGPEETDYADPPDILAGSDVIAALDRQTAAIERQTAMLERTLAVVAALAAGQSLAEAEPERAPTRRGR